MADPKIRREPSARSRPRTKPDVADDLDTDADARTAALEEAEAPPVDDDLTFPRRPEPEEAAPPPEPEPRAEREPPPAPPERRPEAPARNEENYGGAFDEEVNSRYEEIKRGSTHISALQ